MKILLAAFISFFCIFNSIQSQSLLRHIATIKQPADTAALKRNAKKNGWRAGAEVFGINTTIWAYNEYIAKKEYSHIGFRSWQKNLKKGFIWDNDNMVTNMFAHPYHGALYFNAARSNNFNYYQSAGFAFAGSAMWELFMETEYPSTNDIIVTPIGGIAIGEVLFRASDLAIDETARGWERFKHEALAFAISPGRGLTRILNGDAWKVRGTRGRQFGVPDISAEISMGIRALELKDDLFDKGVGFGTNIIVEYGDKYETSSTPYSYFHFNADLNIQDSQPFIGHIGIIGRLFNAELLDTSKDLFTIGVYQHFDYYDSDTISSISNKTPYEIAAPASFGVGLLHQSKRFKDWDFNSVFYGNGIILGSSLSDYYSVRDRNYNLGSGFGFKGSVSISYKDRIGVSGNIQYYHLYTWKGYKQNQDIYDIDYHDLNVQGDKSSSVLTTSNIKVQLKLKKQWYLTGIGSIFKRSTHYKYYEDIYSTSAEGKIMLTYKF